MVIVLTVPLVPLFMVLIGRYTEERVREAQSALARLSGHMLELAKGLPVLVGLGRATAQRKALEDISEEYRSRTMGTLRTAFLSALALELIATISVAVVAVFIGVRLVHGDMALEAGLLALILAPDCYLPLRELGTAHHASDDGRAALAETTAVLDATPEPRPLRPARTRRPPVPAAGAARPSAVRDGLTVRFGGTDGRRRRAAELHRRRRAGSRPSTAPAAPARAPCSACWPGPSGRATAPPLPDASKDSRRRTSPGCRSIPSWWPPRCWTRSGCIWASRRLRRRPRAGATAAGRGRRCGSARCLAAVRRGAPGGQAPGRAQPGGAAPGGAGPRAGPDRGRRHACCCWMNPPPTWTGNRPPWSAGPSPALRGQVTVLLVAHDRHDPGACGHTRPVPAGGRPRRRTSGRVTPLPASAGGRLAAAAAAQPAAGDAVGAGSSPGRRDPGPAPLPAPPPSRPAPAAAPARQLRRPGRPVDSRQLRRLLAPVAAKFAAAGAVGTLAALFAVALAGLSGWLIIRASEQPPILYLLTAIVGVRFFGVGRAALRYAERLLLHDAVFAALTRLRGRLWESLSRRALSLRRLLQGGNVLGHGGGRRRHGPGTAAPRRPAAADRRGRRGGRSDRDRAAAARGAARPWPPPRWSASSRPRRWRWRRTGCPPAPNSASAPACCGTWRPPWMPAPNCTPTASAAPVLAAIGRADRAATAASQRSAWAEGLGQGLTVLACGTAALASAVLAAPLALGGAVEPATVAVVVLLQLALVEPYAAITTAVRQYPALRAVLRRISAAGVLEPGTDGTRTPARHRAAWCRWPARPGGAARDRTAWTSRPRGLAAALSSRASRRRPAPGAGWP